MPAFDQVDKTGSVMTRMTKIVRKIDIGSFSPDSTSNNAVTRSGSARWARRSIVPTAAASVGETAAPNSMATTNGTPATSMTVPATTAAVMPTPITASANAGQIASRIIDRCVFSPPSNRITANATLPIR